MTHDWKNVSPAVEDGMKRAFPRQYSIAIAEGAQVYHCTNGPELDLGALRIILGARAVLPKVQQEAVDRRVEELRRELEEEKRRMQEEANGLRSRIAEMQSKLEDYRCGFGKTSITYKIPACSRVFPVGSHTYLALQRVYPSTDFHPNSPIVLMTHFMGRTMNDVSKTSGRMTSSGSLTIWTRHVTTSPFLTGRSSWPVGSRQS